MRRSTKFCQRESNLDGFFLFDFLVGEGRDDPNNTKSRPLPAHKQNVIEMADDGLTLNARLVALLFFKGYILVLLRNPITL